MKTDLYFSSIGYSLGESYEINSVPEVDEEKKSILTSTGLEYYRSSKCSCFELGLESIKKSLSNSNISPKDIDAVIFSSNEMTLKCASFNFKELDQVLFETGIHNSVMLGTFMWNCSNIASAIYNAALFLKSGQHKNILILLADKLDNVQDRFMDSNESILSDGASSFILSSEAGEFQLSGVSLLHDLSHVTTTRNILEYLKNNTEALKKLRNELILDSGNDSEHFSKHFFSNYNMLAQRTFRSQLSLKKEEMYMQNISKNGHVFSSDVLINFSDYLLSNPIDSHDEFIFLTNGFYRWGGFTLKSSN